MSRLWKSQEVFGAPFGPCRAEETALLSSALEAAEHKSPTTPSLEPPSSHSLAQPSSKHAPMSSLSASPFSGSLPALTEDILAAYQDACMRGQATPNFSFSRPSPAVSSESIGNTTSMSYTSQGSDHGNPIFSLGDLSPTLSRTSHSPKLSSSLSASTGHLATVSIQTHRRTRSYFYANGEAPIVAVGAELEDDDQSSDEEANPDTFSAHSATRPIAISQNLGHDVLKGPAPILKSAAMRMPARKRVEEDRGVLPDSPPSRGTNSLRASTANYIGTSSTTLISPREMVTSDLATPPSAPKTQSTPFVASRPPFDLPHSADPAVSAGLPSSTSRPPQAGLSAQGLSQSSFSVIPSHLHHDHHHAPSASASLAYSSELRASSSPTPYSVAPELSDELIREQEWRELECSQHERCYDPSRASLSSSSVNHPHKNRYPSVLALDSSRVKLSPSIEDGSDYINANFVRGAGDSVYISSQAPIPSSFYDFWRMIWEYKVHIIVMLTRLIEGGCPKAHKYWPTSKTRIYGDRYKVTLVNRQESDYEYRVKEFEVEYEGERRRVFQFQFLGWPDHGVPHSPENILHMVKSINCQLQDLKEAPFSEGPSPRVYGTSTVSDASSVASTDTEEQHFLDGSSTHHHPPTHPHHHHHHEPARIKRSSSSQFGSLITNININPNPAGRHESSNLASSSTLPKDSILSEGSSKSASQLTVKSLFIQRPPLLRDSTSPSGSLINLSPVSSVPNSSEASLESSTSSAASIGSVGSIGASSTASSLSSTHSSSLGSARSTSYSHNHTSTVSGGSTTPSTTPSTSSDRPRPCAAKTPYTIGPMVVHCSAGIGRSGAFIIIHSVLEKLAAEGKTFNDINLKQLLDMMRTSREGLVTHQLQYNFCYDSIEYSLRYQRIVQEIGTSGFKGKQRQTLQKSPLTRSSQVIPNMAGPDMDLPS